MAKVKFTLVGKIQITAQQVLFFGTQGTFPAALTSGGSTTTTLTQANFTDFDFNIHTDGELSAAWETNSQAVTIEANGSTFVIPGPDSSEANPKDSTHSYTWRVPGYSYQALVTALIADSSPTIEFSDEDIVPAELAATATAGTPSAVATLAAIDAPEELAATATAGTPSAVATLAAIDAPEELAATATAGTPSAVATLAAIDAPEELAATATAGTPSAVATLAAAGPRLTLSPVFPLHARDGQGFEFIYALHSAEIAANQLPLNEWTFEQVGNGIDRNGVIWTDDAGSVTMAQPLLSISVRKVLAGVNVGDAVPAQWSAPGVVGRYAIDGADGEDAHGFEYIFTSAADESLPLASRPDNAWGFDEGGTAGAHTWTDGAPSLTSALPVLFRSQRAIIGSPSVGAAVADDWTVPVVVGRYAIDGAAGLAGASIHYGAGVPAASLGNDGDIYVRANGLLYTKSGGAWTATGDDLTGPPNARTYAAGVVQAGSTPAVPANAINGSVIIADDGRFWELVGGSWSYRGDLTGPVGPGGGAIRTGSTAPADSLGNDGDLYIRDTGEIYTKSVGTWTDTGIDLISDMAAAAGARIYALGDVAVGSTPAVPSMAIDGSIGVANDGRFWELVNGAWVYRDDLTGPPGEDGYPGILYWIRQLVVGNTLTDLNHLRISGGRFSVVLLGDLITTMPLLRSGDIGVFRDRSDGSIAVFELSGSGTLTSHTGTDSGGSSFQFGRYEFPFTITQGDEPSSGDNVDLGFNSASGGAVEPERAIRKPTPASFDFAKTLSRRYQDSITDVGRNDFHIAGDFAYIGYGTHVEYLRQAAIDTYFEVTVGGSKYQYRILGNRRQYENYISIQVSRVQTASPSYSDNTLYSLRFTWAEPPQPTAETGDGVASVTQSSMVSRVFEDSQVDAHFSANDFRFQRIVGSYDQFDVSRGSQADRTALDALAAGNVVYASFHVVDSGSSVLTQLHWRIREIRNVTINSVASTTLICDPLETSAFALTPQATYVLNFDTTQESSNRRPGTDDDDDEIETIPGLSNYAQNTEFIRTYESDGDETSFGSGEFHYVRAGTTQAFIIAKGSNAEFLEAVPALTYISVDVDGTDYHFQILITGAQTFNGIAVQTFILAAVQAQRPPFVDGTAYTFSTSHEEGLPTIRFDLARLRRDYQTNPSLFTAKGLYLDDLADPTQFIVGKGDEGHYLDAVARGSFIYVNVSGAERDILRIKNSQDTTRNGMSAKEFTVERADSDAFQFATRGFGNKDINFTHIVQPEEITLNLTAVGLDDVWKETRNTTSRYVDRSARVFNNAFRPFDTANSNGDNIHLFYFDKLWGSQDDSITNIPPRILIKIVKRASPAYFERLDQALAMSNDVIADVKAEVVASDSIYSSIRDNPLFATLAININGINWSTGINYFGENPFVRPVVTEGLRSGVATASNSNPSTVDFFQLQLFSEDITEGLAPLRDAIPSTDGGAVTLTIRTYMWPGRR